MGEYQEQGSSPGPSDSEPVAVGFSGSRYWDRVGGSPCLLRIKIWKGKGDEERQAEKEVQYNAGLTRLFWGEDTP
jgi:hypothetical protein